MRERVEGVERARERRRERERDREGVEEKKRPDPRVVPCISCKLKVRRRSDFFKEPQRKKAQELPKFHTSGK